MTEEEANKILELIGDSIVKTPGINFIAVRSEDSKDYYLEIGFNKNKINLPETIKTDFLHTLSISPLINKCLNESEEALLFNQESSIIATTVASENDFRFHNKKLRPGVKIERQGNKMQPGTLGIFVSLENRKGVYFISNYHVVMGNYIQIGKKIVHTKSRKIIGELFWGIFNNYYDIAIVKLNEEFSDNFNSESQCFKFSGNIDDPKIGMSVGISGAMSICNLEKDKLILSRNAYVSLNEKTFKNQILTSKISMRGDSGSFMINKDTNDILGIIIGGDEVNYSVCNYIHPIFNCNIPAYPYKYIDPNSGQIKTGVLPEFKIKSIFTN